MAVISVKERFQDRRSSYADGTVTHLRVFLVKCDDPADGTAVAMAAEGLPVSGSTHPKDGRARLNRTDCDVHENSDRHFLWRGEYTGSAGSFAVPADPLKRPPTFSIGANETQEDYFIDCSTPPKRVTSTSGDAFENNLTRFGGETTITLGLNEATFSVLALEHFKWTTNKDEVWIDGQKYAADTLLMAPMQATKHKETLEQDGLVTPVKFYAVTWNLRVSATGWKDKCLDLGYNELFLPVGDPPSPPKAEVRPIWDKSMGKVQKPWPLDGAGKKKPLPTDTPATIEFVPYRSVNWLPTFRVFTQEIWAD